MSDILTTINQIIKDDGLFDATKLSASIPLEERPASFTISVYVASRLGLPLAQVYDSASLIGFSQNIGGDQYDVTMIEEITQSKGVEVRISITKT